METACDRLADGGGEEPVSQTITKSGGHQMCNGLDGRKRNPYAVSHEKGGPEQDEWTTARSTGTLGVGDGEQARMLTLIRWQNGVGSACSERAFSLAREERRGSRTGVVKPG
jgi:hypothetical protein